MSARILFLFKLAIGFILFCANSLTTGMYPVYPEQRDTELKVCIYAYFIILALYICMVTKKWFILILYQYMQNVCFLYS